MHLTRLIGQYDLPSLHGFPVFDISVLCGNFNCNDQYYNHSITYYTSIARKDSPLSLVLKRYESIHWDFICNLGFLSPLSSPVLNTYIGRGSCWGEVNNFLIS